MKKLIFQLFTVENQILLPAPVLDHISNHYKDLGSINSLLLLCKSKLSTSLLSMELLLEISSKKNSEIPQFALKSFKYSPFNPILSFLALRPLLPLLPHSISLLKPGDDQVIFGLFSRGVNGKYILEDEHDTVELDLDDVENECFVFENMFVGLRGLKADAFKVKETILPKFPVYLPSVQKNRIIIIAGGFDGEVECLKSVILRESADLCIISSTSQGYSGAGFGVLSELGCSLVVSPDRRACEHIPFSFQPDLNQRGSSVTSASNPFITEVSGNLIGFIDEGVFDSRREGVFFNCNSIEKFLEAVISQGTMDPFCGSDLTVGKFPNFLVISQDSHPVVLDVCGVKVMSIPRFKEGYFGIINFEAGIFEIRCIL